MCSGKRNGSYYSSLNHALFIYMFYNSLLRRGYKYVWVEIYYIVFIRYKKYIYVNIIVKLCSFDTFLAILNKYDK